MLSTCVWTSQLTLVFLQHPSFSSSFLARLRLRSSLTSPPPQLLRLLPSLRPLERFRRTSPRCLRSPLPPGRQPVRLSAPPQQTWTRQSWFSPLGKLHHGIILILIMHRDSVCYLWISHQRYDQSNCVFTLARKHQSHRWPFSSMYVCD